MLTVTLSLPRTYAVFNSGIATSARCCPVTNSVSAISLLWCNKNMQWNPSNCVAAPAVEMAAVFLAGFCILFLITQLFLGKGSLILLFHFLDS